MEPTSIEAKQNFWRSHSDTWRASGLTQKEYCESAGISFKSFIYQHHRITAKANKPALKFIESRSVQNISSGTATRLQLIFPNGIRIGIDGELNAPLLQTLFSIAGGVSC